MVRLSHLFITITCCFVIISCAGKKQAEPNNPNVLFIIADDLGYTDIEAYGSSFYDTPNINSVIDNSVKFNSGYANSPVCSPSRASFQTGKYPVKTGVTDWIKGRKAFQGTTVTDRWIVPDTDYELKLEETTIAEVLRKNNYVTAFIGKWHLGEEEKYFPEYQGYDINIAGWKMGRPNTGKGKKGYFSPYGNPRLKDGPIGEYLPDRLTEEAIKILKDNIGKPTFICLSYYLVHGPFQAKKNEIEIYNKKRIHKGINKEEEFLENQSWMQFATGNNPKKYKERIKQGHPIYAAMVKSLDDNIGKLVNYLKTSGQYDNTLIIFVSDNGGLSTKEGSPTSNLPLAKGKGWMHEGGIRVPFFIKPPRFKSSKISDIPVTGIDIFPTILSYTDNHSIVKDIDGVDLKPLIEANKPLKKRPIYWHYPHYGNQGANPSSAVRFGDYKLIQDLETGGYELYNLKEDIGETTNLFNSKTDIAEKLKKMLTAWVSENYNRPLIENPEWNKKDSIINYN
ncbi:sulfatase [Seonamhaeicola sp.]|uniref:sulfatase n=1 Tax=Seonamhaeicola sp. TaxID=1912245 RepID=UPI002611EDF4|nr:sulfatase [Seonamhaeicola sp.]